MTVSSTALASIGKVKNYLSISTEQSVLLEPLVNAVSARIENWLDRKILSQSYSELYDRPQGCELALRQPDVTSVSVLFTDTESALRLQYAGTGTHARVEVTDTSLTLISRLGATPTTSTLTFAANVTTTALATAIAVVTGWSATLVKDGPSAYLVRKGSHDAKSQEISLDAWVDYAGAYDVNYGAGIIIFNGYGQWSDQSGYAWTGLTQYPRSSSYLLNGSVRYRVDYVAGFSTIPNDVELTALEMIADAWARKGRDLTVKSETLGDYSWTAADITDIDTNAVWSGRLSRYRRIVP